MALFYFHFPYGLRLRECFAFCCYIYSTYIVVQPPYKLRCVLRIFHKISTKEFSCSHTCNFPADTKMFVYTKNKCKHFASINAYKCATKLCVCVCVCSFTLFLLLSQRETYCALLHKNFYFSVLWCSSARTFKISYTKYQYSLDSCTVRIITPNRTHTHTHASLHWNFKPTGGVCAIFLCSENHGYFFSQMKSAQIYMTQFSFNCGNKKKRVNFTYSIVQKELNKKFLFTLVSSCMLTKNYCSAKFSYDSLV